MNIRSKKTAAVVLAGIGVAFAVTAGGCSAADTTSKNLSTAADNFEVPRRIVFFNGITDKYLLTIEGRCSIEPDSAGKKLDVTCKTGDDSYKKHMLGLSDNVSYFVEQTESVQSDPFHYRVDFRPETIIPDINLKVSK
jgi:hypothetical protein